MARTQLGMEAAAQLKPPFCRKLAALVDQRVQMSRGLNTRGLNRRGGGQKGGFSLVANSAYHTCGAFLHDLAPITGNGSWMGP